MLGARKVVAPDGRTWKVGRRWLPEPVRLWRRRRRDAEDGLSAGDLLGLGADDLGAGVFLAGLAVVLVVGLLLLVVWPLVALALEVLLLLVLFVAGVVGRLLRRRPWVVRARTRDLPAATHSWDVVGWRASGERKDAAARALAAGEEP